MLGERKKIQHLENVESRDLDIFTWILLKISEKNTNKKTNMLKLLRKEQLKSSSSKYVLKNETD